MPVSGSLKRSIRKFDLEAAKHQEGQSSNPFSGSFSPRASFSKEEYGRPPAGSRTEERGLRAKYHINKEILELCHVIYELAFCNREMKRCRNITVESDGDCEDNGNISVTFGELFETYTRISNKVVGLLIQAKKKGLVYFENEMLFQRRDDQVLIFLLKPINEIKAMAQENHQPESWQMLEVGSAHN